MDIIIIGAGAAGLMAAKKLATAGRSITILEARNGVGGRIFSFNNSGDKCYEGGAESIHGNLKTTLDLLNEAGIEKQELSGEMWNVKNGNWSQESEFFENAEKVIEKLKVLDEDVSIETFLQTHFGTDQYKELRDSMCSYVEGYYSGETFKTSSKSFLKEWLSEDHQQYRPAGGYGRMIEYLIKSIEKLGVKIELSSVVKEIKWKKGRVEIVDISGRSYLANKVIVTVPLGVWTADETEEGSIQYTPALYAKKNAAKQMGFGSVIKILIKFKEDFFSRQLLKNQQNADLSKLHMAITDQSIPTWWTQYPNNEPLLTGWLSGPKAAEMKHDTDDDILRKSIDFLHIIFNVDIDLLVQNVEWSKVFNWTQDSYTRGSYSYSTLQTFEARKTLMEPVEDTLFFAGEALYDGPEMGTVEAALVSGNEVASVILTR